MMTDDEDRELLSAVVSRYDIPSASTEGQQ